MESVKKYSVLGALNNVSDIGCRVEQIEFIQNGMFDCKDISVPAGLLDAPLKNIKEKLEELEEYLKAIEKLS